MSNLDFLGANFKLVYEPHISISPEVIAKIGSFSITNSFLNALIGLVICAILVIAYSMALKRKNKCTFFYTINALLLGVYNLFGAVLKEKINKVFPLLSAFFFFILIQNWLGLLPGVGSFLITAPKTEAVYETNHNNIEEVVNDKNTTEESMNAKSEEHVKLIPLFRAGTADLNTTIVLALIAFFTIQIYGISYVGIGGYLSKFFDFRSIINFIVGIFEIVSEFSKIISFSFRLFGNVIAGEIILTIIGVLVPWFASFPFLLFEIFVGIMQAFVFSMLIAVFISIATAKNH